MSLVSESDFLLDVNDVKGLQAYLQNIEHLNEGETVSGLEVAGEGNMNMVLRVQTNQRSFILKQSRPWVVKYPQVKAPVDRILNEYAFYQLVSENETIKKFVPEVCLIDADNFILCLEDLGQASDFTSIYKKGVQLDKNEVADIAKVVSELHFGFQFEPEEDKFLNTEMRKLNHAHIFNLPLSSSNGFDLDGVLAGLQPATDKFRNDRRLKDHAAELGEIYLGNTGTRLLHGDYYPGSWLKTDKGFRMIDPEFCFTGSAEFELGVAVAHLKMAHQSDSLMKDMFVYYHFDSRFDGSLFSKFAGMEIIRRLIGLAQLPLELDLKERVDLLDEAYELVING